MANAAIYSEIVEDLRAKIDQGLYHSGDRLLSRQKICDIYGVSNMTAFRVHSELQARGLAKTIPGKGIFVAAQKKSPGPDVQTEINKAVMLVHSEVILSDQRRFEWRIFDGLRKHAAEKNYEFRIETVNIPGTSDHFIPIHYRPHPGEGVIIIEIGPIRLSGFFQILLSPSIPSAITDNFIPGSYCAVTDNRQGIIDLLDFLKERGHRKVLLASRFSDHQNQFNENERHEAFITETKNKGLDGNVIDSGNFDDLVEVVRSRNAPDAVMFCRDEPAIKFKKILASMKPAKNIQVTGFDDFAMDVPELENLTTLRVDTTGLGAAALDMLFENKLVSWQAPYVRRVPGKLQVRD